MTSLTRFEKEALLSLGTGAYEYTLDPRKLRAGIRFLVEHANDETGEKLSIERLDSGLKNFSDLVRDAQRKEVIMRLSNEPDINGVTNRLLKLAFKVEAFLFAWPYVIVEVGREFIRKGEYVPTTEFRGVRGTIPRGKGQVKAMVDEVRHETGIRISRSQLMLIPQNIRASRFDPPSWRNSTVYQGIPALDIPYYYHGSIPKPRWKTRVSPPDGGVRVHFKVEHWDNIDKEKPGFTKKIPPEVPMLHATH